MSENGAHIAYIPGIRYRLVNAEGATVSVVRRYLGHSGLPAGWYIDRGAPSIAMYLGTEDMAKQVIVAQAAALGLDVLIP